eukprot:gene13847-biopygen5061
MGAPGAAQGRLMWRGAPDPERKLPTPPNCPKYPNTPSAGQLVSLALRRLKGARRGHHGITLRGTRGRVQQRCSGGGGGELSGDHFTDWGGWVEVGAEVL